MSYLDTILCDGMYIMVVFSLENIYDEFDKVIKRTSHKEDLTWFSQHHGKDMPRFFPQYEVCLSLSLSLLLCINSYIYIYSRNRL